MAFDIMKPQVIQSTTTTRSAAVPVGASRVDVALACDDGTVTILAELQGLTAAGWLPLLDATFPGPGVTRAGDIVSRVRLILDPSEPVSVGATISIS